MDTFLNRSSLARLCGRVALWLFVVASVIPLWIALKTALTPNEQLFDTAGSFFPDSPTLFNFQRVLGLVDEDDPRLAQASLASINFLGTIFNSAIFTALVAVPQIFFSSLASYAFARLEFPFRKVLFFLFIAASMIPAAVLFIPNFILVKELGLLNSFVGMAAPYMFMTPFAVFYLRQVFLSSPKDVEEAARIDGASFFTVFWRIMLPMHRSSIITLTILTTISAWNEFFWPFLTGRDDSVQVMTVALNAYRTQQPMGSPDWTGLMACAVLGALPMLAMLILLGRKVVESFQFSGAK